MVERLPRRPRLATLADDGWTLLDVERAYRTVLIGYRVWPLQLYATWLLLDIWQSDLPLRPASQRRHYWALGLHLPMLIVAVMVIGLMLRGECVFHQAQCRTCRLALGFEGGAHFGLSPGLALGRRTSAPASMVRSTERRRPTGNPMFGHQSIGRVSERRRAAPSWRGPAGCARPG